MKTPITDQTLGVWRLLKGYLVTQGLQAAEDYGGSEERIP